MPNDKSQATLIFTIIKKGNREWFIEPSNKNKMGPYHSATVALQLAAVEALLARKSGLKAQIFVQDDYGTAHLCHALDKPDDPQRCSACEHSWVTASRPLPPRCPVREALGDR